MANYRLHSMSIFLHYQIRVSYAHALYVHMLIFFKKLVHNLTLGKSASKCLYSEMSKFAAVVRMLYDGQIEEKV